MDFREQLCSAVILGPKWSNTKFISLHGPSPLSHFEVYFGHVVDNIGEHRSGCAYCGSQWRI